VLRTTLRTEQQSDKKQTTHKALRCVLLQPRHDYMDALSGRTWEQYVSRMAEVLTGLVESGVRSAPLGICIEDELGWVTAWSKDNRHRGAAQHMLSFCIYTCFMPLSVSSIDVNVLFDSIPLALEGLAAVGHTHVLKLRERIVGSESWYPVLWSGHIE